MAGNEGRTGQVPPIALTRPANTTTTSHATLRQACSLADKVVALHDFMDFVDHRFSCLICNCRCLFYIFFCLGCNECKFLLTLLMLFTLLSHLFEFYDIINRPCANTRLQITNGKIKG